MSTCSPGASGFLPAAKDWLADANVTFAEALALLFEVPAECVHPVTGRNWEVAYLVEAAQEWVLVMCARTVPQQWASSSAETRQRHLWVADTGRFRAPTLMGLVAVMRGAALEAESRLARTRAVVTFGDHGLSVVAASVRSFWVEREQAAGLSMQDMEFLLAMSVPPAAPGVVVGSLAS